MDLGLEGRQVLITGGSRGIGLASAKRFAEEGCALHLVGRTASRLEEARERLSKDYGATVETYTLDMSKSASIDTLGALAPRIDILVNNAGELPVGDIFSLDETGWRTGFDSKVFSYINLTRAILPAMRDRRSGVVVNVVGLIGQKPAYDAVCRSAANAALIAFTKAVGSRSVDYNVRVVGINPPGTRTEKSEAAARKRAMTEFGDEERWTDYSRSRPFGRLAETRELADAIVFLASDRASYMSGSLIDMDGGFLHR